MPKEFCTVISNPQTSSMSPQSGGECWSTLAWLSEKGLTANLVFACHLLQNEDGVSRLALQPSVDRL